MTLAAVLLAWRSISVRRSQDFSPETSASSNARKASAPDTRFPACSSNSPKNFSSLGINLPSHANIGDDPQKPVMAWRNLTVLLQLFVTFVREDCYRSGNSTVTQRFEFRETATAPKRRRTHAERDPGGLAPPTFVDDICQVRGLSGPE